MIPVKNVGGGGGSVGVLTISWQVGLQDQQLVPKAYRHTYMYQWFNIQFQIANLEILVKIEEDLSSIPPQKNIQKSAIIFRC